MIVDINTIELGDRSPRPPFYFSVGFALRAKQNYFMLQNLEFQSINQNNKVLQLIVHHPATFGGIIPKSNTTNTTK
jgi:hypothetical protein